MLGTGRDVSTNVLKQPQFAWRRHGISSSTQHHPQRVATWFTWGDLGFTGVKTTCGNKYCCNPFHLIPQNVGVFVDHDSYLESFELACELHTLKQQVAEYVMEEAMKEQEKMMDQEVLEVGTNLMLNPNTMFDERFEAVMVDMLAGRHISQTKPDGQTLYDQLKIMKQMTITPRQTFKTLIFIQESFSYVTSY